MKLSAAVLILSLSVLMVACGGHNTAINNPPTPVPTPTPQPVHKTIAFGKAMFPGFHGTTSKQTTTTTAGITFDILPRAYAQSTTTTTYQGTYSATCASSPAVPIAAGAKGIVMYGMGQISNPLCDITLGNLDQNGSTRGAVTNVGIPVGGDGTLTELKIEFGAPDTVFSLADSGLTNVWVVRGNTILADSLQCQPTLDQTSQSYNCDLKNASLAVKNNDHLVMVVKLNPGDRFRNAIATVYQQ